MHRKRKYRKERQIGCIVGLERVGELRGKDKGCRDNENVLKLIEY